VKSNKHFAKIKGLEFLLYLSKKTNKWGIEYFSTFALFFFDAIFFSIQIISFNYILILVLYI